MKFFILCEDCLLFFWWVMTRARIFSGMQEGASFVHGKTRKIPKSKSSLFLRWTLLSQRPEQNLSFDEV